ncbi:DUF4197 family protein [Caenimonas koreensis DSM 17982]|uniref:DUF4197 family protein n=1 Tax=Caenimonas koreensis DSM 17982 TaxID=1121255 RepID=A0A844B6B9_9BURK|nr:DUF4197 domain-containing protein [Caenimonas koreensis]MRD48722.1 DUF4197 family protein [Caenimonas koreensis DSM 17982]
MLRREFSLSLSSGLLLPALLVAHHAQAQGLAAITDAEAGNGLRSALEKGALSAVNLLGAQGGFLDNPKVHIPLPGYLHDAAKLLKAMGKRKEVEELEVAINRAAESAVPLAKDLLVKAVKNISVTDAKRILLGGETSVTQFFADKTREPIGVKFLPVVKQATARVGLAQKYDRIAGKAAGMGLVKKDDATIDHYVTRKALDGLYFMIGEEEKKIRRDPVGTGSALLGKVFGALR